MDAAADAAESFSAHAIGAFVAAATPVILALASVHAAGCSMPCRRRPEAH